MIAYLLGTVYRLWDCIGSVATPRGMFHKALFTDPNVKTQRKGVTCPRSHSWQLRVGRQSGSNQHLWPLTPRDCPLCCSRGGGLLVLGPFSGALQLEAPPRPVLPPRSAQEAQSDHAGYRQSCPKTSQICSSSAATSCVAR